MERKFLDNRVLFSLLVYVKDLVDHGKFDDEGFYDSVYKNAEEHGHSRFLVPDEWKAELKYLINKFGWRIFKAGEN